MIAAKILPVLHVSNLYRETDSRIAVFTVHSNQLHCTGLRHRIDSQYLIGGILIFIPLREQGPGRYLRMQKSLGAVRLIYFGDSDGRVDVTVEVPADITSVGTALGEFHAILIDFFRHMAPIIVREISVIALECSGNQDPV